jgi:predicted Ser/Thr protein kinase
MTLESQDAVTRCQFCDAGLRADAAWFGLTLRCPRCDGDFKFQALCSGETVDRARLSEQTVGEKDVAKASRERSSESPRPRSGSSASMSVPKQLGRYVPKSCLGRGGFGVVYRAYDPTLDRDVAIKLPLADAAGRSVEVSEAVRERFAKEARAAARLRHPNIVAVFDHGYSDEGVFIVYEFIPGKTLEQVMQADGLSRQATLSLTATLADALLYAAEAGIVHRDIKPSNVMIDQDGRPQIMDFGLAEAMEEGKAMTGGKIAGTPIYMSPEQARGDSQVGSATDQYSLCAILYELLTGTRPVQSKGVAAVAEVASRDRPPVEPLQALPLDLRRVVLKGMHKDPEQRYEHTGVLASDLRAFQNGYPVIANPGGPFSRTWKWSQRNRSTALALAATAALLIAIAAVSTTFAFRLKRQSERLASALSDAKEARREADEHAQEAQRQQAIAEEKAALATESQRFAQAEAERAREALQRERQERLQRQAAETLADAETLSKWWVAPNESGRENAERTVSVPH